MAVLWSRVYGAPGLHRQPPQVGLYSAAGNSQVTTLRLASADPQYDKYTSEFQIKPKIRQRLNGIVPLNNAFIG